MGARERMLGGLAAGVLVLAGGLGLSACRQPGGMVAAPGIRVMFWNAQNLFDDINQGNEYAEFRVAAKPDGPGRPGASPGWNRTAYRQRLERCARVVKEGAALPDIVVLEEIESRKVLDDLCAGFLPTGAYPLRCLQADDAANIHIGLLARLPLLRMRSHRYAIGTGTARPVWELHFAAGAGGAELVVFANHWKSRSGDGAADEALRVLAARVLAREAERETGGGRLVLAGGDFNQVPGEAGPAGGAAPSLAGALRRAWGSMPDSARPAGQGAAAGQAPDRRHAGRVLGGKPFALLASPAASLALRRLPGGQVALADCLPAWTGTWREDTEGGAGFCRDGRGQPGSYFWDGRWEPIDHILLAPGGGDWRTGDLRVVAPDFLVDGSGLPRRWDSRTGQGVSDHLPLLIEILPPRRPPGRRNQGQRPAGSRTARTSPSQSRLARGLAGEG